MRTRSLIISNLLYFWKKNLLLASGIAISGAVLTGALIVGGSVRYSLNRLVDQRLGRVTHVVRAGDRYFTGGLAGKMEEQLGVPVSPLLIREGVAVAGGGRKRVNRVQVLGVDPTFDRVTGQEGTYGRLKGDTVIISRNLSNRLGISRGEEFLIQVEKASWIPRNAPFIQDDGGTVSLRVVVGDVAGVEKLGGFNLGISQIAPFNLFISLDRLREAMEFGDGINTLLLDGRNGLTSEEVWRSLGDRFTLGDAGLKMEVNKDLQVIEITSDRVFIDRPLVQALESAGGDASAGSAATEAAEGTTAASAAAGAGEDATTGSAAGGAGEGILTYFVNRFETPSDTTPYSFISTLPDLWLRPGEIIINSWLAEDLSVRAGDSLKLAYFEVGPLRELVERTASFRIRSVVPISGRFGDRSLMPLLPGLSDAGNCRDWETGVPISLDRIRDKDEDYWDQYRGTPKAFVSRSTGVGLWQNRFGVYTSYRFPASSTDPGRLEKELLNRIDPRSLGFTVDPVRSQGTSAAGGGVDFSQLFGGLSFFLVAAGIILTILLFLLNLHSRDDQLRTLVVMGLPVKWIGRVMMWEGALTAVAGALAGTGLSLIYNLLVFRALNGVWRDVVRTSTMEIHWDLATLASGFAATLLIALFALWIPLTRNLRAFSRAHRKPGKPGVLSRPGGRRTIFVIFLVSGITGFGLIGSQVVRGELVNASLFFSAGSLLLISAVFLFFWLIARSRKDGEEAFGLPGLSWKNAARNRTRSISIVLLLAIGAFLVISTGSNRKDLFQDADDPASGTGGYLYYAESTLPVLKDLNDPGVQNEYGLEGEASFVQFRRAAGDDASCLNLNKIVQPRILGVDPSALAGRFTFVSASEYLEKDDPWSSLEKELPGGLIPAIADETVIKWSLGMEVGDTLRYTNSTGGTMQLLLVGGLAPSVFQGHVIIDAGRFLEQFPESSGTHVFMVEGAVSDSSVIRTGLERGLRDLGLDMELSAARLAEFNSVTNTYLSIFMVMGALGLLVGIFGVAVVLSRSVQERKQEIALLRAVGYGKRPIRRLVMREYMILVVYGIGGGFLTAVIATLPSLASSHTGSSMKAVAFWLAILLANCLVWIQLITRLALTRKNLYTALRNE